MFISKPITSVPMDYLRVEFTADEYMEFTGPLETLAPIETEPEPEIETEPPCIPRYTEDELIMVAQVIWGEARGCTPSEQMLVAWCICNRVDYNGTDIATEIRNGAFHGYSSYNPVEDAIYLVAKEVLDNWSSGEEALVYPPYAYNSDYLYFGGDGRHNWFRHIY